MVEGRGRIEAAVVPDENKEGAASGEESKGPRPFDRDTAEAIEAGVTVNDSKVKLDRRLVMGADSDTGRADDSTLKDGKVPEIVTGAGSGDDASLI